MNTNANNNASNANDNNGKDKVVHLDAAVAAIRTAIQGLQGKIDAEQDPAKKVQLIAEMKKLTADIGFVFDDNKPAAEKAAKEMKEKANATEQLKDQIMDSDKPSVWTRIKNFTKEKFGKTKSFVKQHKVATVLTLAGIVAAVAALVIARNRNANNAVVLVHGYDAATMDASQVKVETTVTADPVVEPTVEQLQAETVQQAEQAEANASSFITRVGDAAIRGVIGAKDLAVRGAVATKDLVVAGAQKVGGLFTRNNAPTPYTVNVEATPA